MQKAIFAAVVLFTTCRFAWRGDKSSVESPMLLVSSLRDTFRR